MPPSGGDRSGRRLAPASRPRNSGPASLREGIPPGRVAGVHQIARGEAGGACVITLDLEMSVGVPGPHDRVQVTGDPPLDVVLQGGVQGDRGTVGAVLSAIPRVLSGPPGLRTVADLPLFGLLL